MSLSIAAFIHETSPTPKKERGPRGEVGKGTPSKRLKRACPNGVRLKAFARGLVADVESHSRKSDARAWLASKGLK